MIYDEGHYYVPIRKPIPEREQDYLMIVMVGLTKLFEPLKAIMKNDLLITNQANYMTDIKSAPKNLKVVIVTGDLDDACQLGEKGFFVWYAHYGEMARDDLLTNLINEGYHDENIEHWMRKIERVAFVDPVKDFNINRRNMSMAEIVSIIATLENYDLRLKLD